MAFNVTILDINDETQRARLLFEDTSSGLSKAVSVTLPQEFASENDLLDYLATLWPAEDFTQRGKAPADRHKEAKLIVGQKKNITGRVQSP